VTSSLAQPAKGHLKAASRNSRTAIRRELALGQQPRTQKTAAAAARLAAQ